MVAIKIIKDPNAIRKTAKEVSMLEALRVLDSHCYNLVKFFGRFEYRGLTCLAFEMLEMNVFDLIRSRQWEPLTPSEIRPIAKQLLVTLEGLKRLGVIHTDLKMDNMMLTNVKEKPFRLKVIDFGEARYSHEVRPGMRCQPCGFRAPEVSLGSMFNEAIDVFSLGCNLAFLYLGYYLFPINCKYQMVKRMVEILGYPPEHLLSNGVYTEFCFKEVIDYETWSSTWTLRTQEEYEEVTKTKTEEYDGYGCEMKSLDDLVDAFPKWEDAEHEDRKALVDLLKGLLHPDPCWRLTPQQALQHCFITMSHLHNLDSLEYLRQSEEVMQVCPTGGSYHEVPFEDISTVPGEQTKTMELKNEHTQHIGSGSPASQLSSSSWCETVSLEYLEGPNSNVWDHGLSNDESYDVLASLGNETVSLWEPKNEHTQHIGSGSSAPQLSNSSWISLENLKEGLDSNIWDEHELPDAERYNCDLPGPDTRSLEDLKIESSDIPVPFDSWLSNDGQIPLQNSKDGTVSFSSFDIRFSDDAVWSDGDVEANRPGQSQQTEHNPSSSSTTSSNGDHA